MPIKCIVMASIIFLWTASVCGQPCKLIVRVIAPPSTPSDALLQLVGNQAALGDWFFPDAPKMERSNDSVWTYTGSFSKSTFLSFKVIRGSYYNEALFGGSTDFPPNLSFYIRADTTVVLHPYSWNDVLNNSVTGTVNYYHNFDCPLLRFSRNVTVWLPPSYASSPGKRYPVLYAQDGQNLFDASFSFGGHEWHMDEIADSLIRAGATDEFIIVGIDNTHDRWQEYSGTEVGRKYLDFIVHRLKPFVDSVYRTRADRENTAMLGSSMGGLISFYMLWLHPDVFSKAACLSGGFAYDPGDIVDSAGRSTARLAGTRIYLDCGDRDLDLHFLPDNRKMAGYLSRDARLKAVFKIFPGATHNEQAWAGRIWEPLVFLFGAK